MISTRDNEIIANIKSDNALAIILSNFDSNYIIHMVQDSINMRFRPYNTALPSLYSIESNFKTLLSGLDSTDDINIINDTRLQTYKEVIGTVCNNFNLSCNIADDQDIYSAAYWIYQFFVADFTNSLFEFFINYIMREKDNLYEYLNLNDTRKDKDAATNYSKKLCVDNKLGLIHANISLVLDSICNFDIPINDLINCGMFNNDPVAADFLNRFLIDNGNVFKTYFAYLLSTGARADIITNVKLRLQKFAGNSEMSNVMNIISK